MSREEAMRRHPSARARHLVADAQRQLAADIEAGDRVDLELFMGGPLSAREARRQDRMDRQACALTTGEPWWLRTPVAQLLAGVLVVASIVIVVAVACGVAVWVWSVAPAVVWPVVVSVLCTAGAVVVVDWWTAWYLRNGSAEVES